MPGFLERIEIQNFKSYKGSHVIGFTKFAAIIGPNGCGKSNLMDAISFVLGEKTANLRVRSVKDLIHGAPVGKPVSTTATVTAVYVDSDGVEEEKGAKKEIVYTRKIVGSGTEYKINNVVVTNKEYQQALRDIGILIKAKNFLVFQGAVESIAMKTSKERTAMFEKISGSGELALEYEEKKQAMTKAEEETAFFLGRKKGVTAEKREAKVERDEAMRFQEKTQELVKAKMDEQLFKLFHAEQEIEAIQSRLMHHDEEIDKVTKRKKKVEEKLKAERSEHGKLQRNHALKEKTVGEKENDLNRKRPLYIKAKQATQHRSTKLEETKKNLAKTQKKVENQKLEMADLEKQLKEVNELSDNYDAEMAGDTQAQSMELMGTQMGEYNKLKEKAGRKAAGIQGQLDKIKREHKSDEERLMSIQQRKNDLESRHRELEEQREQYLKRVSACEDYEKTNVDRMSELKKECEEIDATVTKANNRYQELNALLEDVQKEIGEAKADKHEMARHQQKQEFVKNLKELFPGVYGRLADLCEPVHKRYAAAVAKVIGVNMEAIVVDTEKTGRECLQYMKEQMISRETYLPLDTIKQKQVNDSYRDLGGSAKLLFDVIKFEPACIKRAVMFACGNAVVCDSMEEAKKIAFSSGERKKTVSTCGTMFRKSGVMSGGLAELQKKVKRFEVKDVDKLKRKRDECLEEIKELNVDRKKESTLQDLKSQINGLESRLKYTRRDKETMQSQSLTFNARELEIINDKLEQIAPSMEKVSAAMEQRCKDMEKVEAKRNVVEDEIFEEFCREIGVENIREYENKQLLEQQGKTQKRLDFDKQKSRLANQIEFLKSHDHERDCKKLERSIRSIEEDIQKFKDSEKDQLKAIDTDTDELAKCRLEMQALAREMVEKDGEIKELKKEVAVEAKEEAALQKKLYVVERQFEEKRSQKLSLLKSCKIESVKLPLKDGSLDNIERLLTQSQTQSDMSEVDSDDQKRRRRPAAIDDGIVVDYRKLDAKYKETESPEELRALYQELSTKVATLTSAVERIVAPNMKAGEKLDEVADRLRNMSDEFETARKHARKTKMEFERVQKERYDRFMDSFEHVSQRIDQIYKELSNNQSAQAFLGAENAEEPYLEGIGYNCVAPGKRFRPMDNLSGGEKTVAALALLFAIHSYQPSPFFVLDEVDAALDNTNINNVANYIKNETDRSFQCIIISLKEEFYTKVDSVVGVTADPDCEVTTTKTFTLDLRQYPE